MHGEVTGEATYAERAFNAIWINGHPKGSIMVRLANLEEGQQTQDEMLKKIDENIEKMPKKLALLLTILTLFIGLVTYVANISSRGPMSPRTPEAEQKLPF
jgi:hypothetical protein